MRVILQRIDRKSRPIRKQERIVAENLKRRRVNLDEDDTFDIMQLIQSSYSQRSGEQPKRPASSMASSVKSTPRMPEPAKVVIENPEEVIPEPPKIIEVVTPVQEEPKLAR